MRRLNVSPIPTGLTPGHLSSAMRRQATRADIPSGSTYPVHNLLASLAMDLHRSSEVLQKEEHILFQLPALSPEGPAEPSIPWTMERIMGHLSDQKLLHGVQRPEGCH